MMDTTDWKIDKEVWKSLYNHGLAVPRPEMAFVYAFEGQTFEPEAMLARAKSVAADKEALRHLRRASVIFINEN